MDTPGWNQVYNRKVIDLDLSWRTNLTTNSENIYKIKTGKILVNIVRYLKVKFSQGNFINMWWRIIGRINIVNYVMGHP